MGSEGTRDKTRDAAARAASPRIAGEHEARTARSHAPTSRGHPQSTMDPTAALNILQNHARQKQAELAQTPPQRRRTSNVAHARSRRASTRRSRTWRASSGPPSTCRIDLFGPVSNRIEPNDTQTTAGRVRGKNKRVLRVFNSRKLFTATGGGPVHAFKWMEDARSYGTVHYVRLWAKNRTQGSKFGFDYDHTSGELVVTRVAPDSSLRCGDVIISLQGECIKYATTGYIDARITRRENTYLTLDVGIVRQRPEAVDEAPATPAPAAPAATVHYITLQPKNRKFGFDYDHTSGELVVTRVAPDSRLRCGDVITSLQGGHVNYTSNYSNTQIDALITHRGNVNGDLELRIVRRRPGAVDGAPAAPAPAAPAATPAPATDPDAPYGRPRNAMPALPPEVVRRCFQFLPIGEQLRVSRSVPELESLIRRARWDVLA